MSPCTNCHSGCCRSFAVPITGADVLRIEQELDLEFAQFACRWEDRDGKIACDFAPHFFFADEPETPFVICLRHEASAVFRKTTRCGFLKEEAPSAEFPLGRAHCGIYDQRPSACRCFPTKLSRSGQLAELHQIPAHGRADSNHAAYSLCSRPWEPGDISPVTALQDLVITQFEMQFFDRVATIWNRALLEFELFPDFLREVYQNRVVVAADAVAEEATILPLVLPQTRRAA